jgi:DNA-binding HxlR family transcriptional regulator
MRTATTGCVLHTKKSAMTKRKETSTNSINRELLSGFCAVNYAIQLIEGRWKMMILYKLENRRLRFSEFKKLIPNITDRMLTLQLKELEGDGLIKRTVFPTTPVKVEYELSDAGQSLSPIWKSLEKWALEHKAKPELVEV